MALSKKPYKGCRDLLPREKREQNFIFDQMQKTAQSFGYEPYDGPMLEEVELYRAKSGQELINDQIYSFTDRGGREVAIRPEMTPTVARIISGIHREVPKPIRWYSIPNLMRYERPQKGRLREHWQFNCDIFGPESIFNEIEILQVAINLFNKFGADENHFGIQINNRTFVDYFFKTSLKLDNKKSYELYKLVDRFKKLKPDAFNEHLSRLELEESSTNLIKKYLNIDSINSFKIFANEISFTCEHWDYESFFKTLDKLDLTKYVEFNSSIVRGLDYYTGLVFEIFDKHPENNRALCGGGSYAGLMDIFGEDRLPGVGFGLGDVTLKDFLVVHKLLPDFSKATPDIFIASEDEKMEINILEISNIIRKNGLSVSNITSKVKYKKISQMAEKLGSKFVGTIQCHQDALKIKIKNTKSGETEVFAIENTNDITTFIKAN